MRHSPKDYEKVDSVALQLRMDYGHLEKVLDVFKLAKDLDIVLIKYSALTEEQLNKIKEYDETKDGFTIFKMVDGELKFYTFYNDSASPYRIRSTIAHEIKHVVFLERDPTEKQEDLANHFARYILAPTCLVMPYVGRYLEDIVSDFDISIEAAGNALSAATNRQLYGHDKLTDYEQLFISMFISR